MTTLTPVAAAGLTGDDWLRARRTAAAEQFAATSLPNADEEMWRYSRIGSLDLDRFHLAASTGGTTAAANWPFELASHGALIVTRNGALSSSTLPEEFLGAPQDLLGAVSPRAPDAFDFLNDGFLQAPITVRVPRRAELTGPIVVVHWIDEADAAVFPRLVLDAEDGADVSVVEIFASADVPALVVPVTELRAGSRARLNYLNIQLLGPAVWQIGSQRADAASQATVTISTAAFGGEYARVHTECRLTGRGATGNLVSLYFGDRTQMLDFRTFQDHQAPDCTSDLLFKGAVDGESHAVYSGLIKVRPQAHGTNAFQTNRNIKLSAGAWAESVPNLEIENNDVHCSHASTVGPVDIDQKFYLGSRGVPPEVAERLIVTGFFDDAIDRLAVPSFAEIPRNQVHAKLSGAR